MTCWRHVGMLLADLAAKAPYSEANNAAYHKQLREVRDYIDTVAPRAAEPPPDKAAGHQPEEWRTGA